jgi:hypothetical protein
MKKLSAKQRVFFFNNNNFPKFYSIKTYEILERNKLFYIVSNSGKNEIFFWKQISIYFVSKLAISGVGIEFSAITSK